MSDQSKPITANEAVRMLRSLPPAALAWLLGTTPRRLRDRPEIPRNSNGTYNAADVFEHETQGAAFAVMEWALRRKH